MTLNGSMILAHGSVVALAASVLIVATLRVNPRLFLKHFPEKVRASQPALSGPEMAVGYLFAIPLFAVLAGGPIASTLVFSRGAGSPLDLISLWAHAFLVGMIFNLVDWLVLDELVLGLGKPRWALPAGVTMEDVTPFDHGRHFADFLKGVIFCAIVALLASAVATGMQWFEGSEV